MCCEKMFQKLITKCLIQIAERNQTRGNNNLLNNIKGQVSRSCYGQVHRRGGVSFRFFNNKNSLLSFSPFHFISLPLTRLVTVRAVTRIFQAPLYSTENYIQFNSGAIRGKHRWIVVSATGNFNCSIHFAEDTELYDLRNRNRRGEREESDQSEKSKQP